MDYSENGRETTKQSFDGEADETKYVRVRWCCAKRGEDEECIAVKVRVSKVFEWRETLGRANGRNAESGAYQRKRDKV